MSALSVGSRPVRSATLGVALLGTLVLGVAAVRSPLIALGGTLALAFVIACFRNLALGTAMFAALTFFHYFPGVGSSSASLAKLAGTILIVAWIADLARNGSLVPPLLSEQPAIAIPALALVGWAFLSALWAADGSVAFSNSTRLVQQMILVFIVASAIRGRDTFRLVCWGYLAGAAITAVVGLAGATSPEQTDATTRLSGGIGDPNEFATILLPALWVSAFGLIAVRHTFGRCLLTATTVLSAVSIFYTESRGGLIGLAITFILAPFLAGRARGRVIATILLVVGVGLVYYVIIAPPQAIYRLTHFTAQGGTGRTGAWQIALHLYHTHPVTGIGLGNFTLLEPAQALGNTNLQRPDLAVNTPIVVHNTYLHILTELGPVGLLLLLLFVFGALRAARASIRVLTAVGDRGTEMLARGLLIGGCGMLASITFISAQSVKQLWLVLAIMAALPAVARAAAVEAPAEAPRPAPLLGRAHPASR